MTSSVAALRARIAEVLAPVRHPPGLPTGVRALDAILPGGGLPIGRLTEVVAPRGGGRATFMRAIVHETVQQGGWVAVIDASRTMAPRDWTFSDSDPRSPNLLFIRPRQSARAPWCADLLLRTGAFALVIVDGAPPLSRDVAARLTRLARDAGSALVVAAELPPVESGAGGATTLLPGALRLRVEPARTHRHPRIRARRRGVFDIVLGAPGLDANGATVIAEASWNGIERRRTGPERRVPTSDPSPLLITVDKGGPRRSVEVSHAVVVARRLCAHPEVPDRRGVARSRASGVGGERHPAGTGFRDSGTGNREPEGAGTGNREPAGPGSGDRESGVFRSRSALVRKRRCAEPVYERERLASILPGRRESAAAR